MDWIATLRRIRASHDAAPYRLVARDASAARITCESDAEGAMDIQVIGGIGWGAGSDVLPLTERLMAERPARVNLYIDSLGGDLFDAMALAAALATSGAAVTARAGALVASAAVPVFLAGSVRTALPYSRFMIHGPRGRFSSFGTAAQIASDLEAFVGALTAATGLYRDSMVRAVGAETADAWIAAEEDVWLDGAEAEDAGLLTEAPEGADVEASLGYLIQGLRASLAVRH